MKKYFILLSICIIALKSFSQNDSAFAIQYIKAARAKSNEAIAKKDINAVAKFWLPDYVEISSDGSLIAGKQPVADDWVKMFKNDPSIVFERQFNSIEFTRNYTVAVEKGILTYTSPYNYKGYYTAIWRKIDGIWMTQMENFVSIL
jgi:ketosteroid isomerase-like protein